MPTDNIKVGDLVTPIEDITTPEPNGGHRVMLRAGKPTRVVAVIPERVIPAQVVLYRRCQSDVSVNIDEVELIKAKEE